MVPELRNQPQGGGAGGGGGHQCEVVNAWLGVSGPLKIKREILSFMTIHPGAVKWSRPGRRDQCCVSSPTYGTIDKDNSG